MTAFSPASSNPRQEPDVPAPLARRLDQLDQHLVEAENVVAKLVGRLEPVLPYGFDTETVPPAPMRAVTESSPLAARLDGLAFRGQDVVQRLRAVLESVDL